MRVIITKIYGRYYVRLYSKTSKVKEEALYYYNTLLKMITDSGIKTKTKPKKTAKKTSSIKNTGFYYCINIGTYSTIEEAQIIYDKIKALPPPY